MVVTDTKNGDSSAIAAKLKKANVQMNIDRRVIRVSPSVYNDVSDVDKLLEAKGVTPP